MPPHDVTSSENFVFATQIELTSLTCGKRILKNSTPLLKNRSMVSQKLGQGIEIEADARNRGIFAATQVLVLA
jgi:hypothetical protein